MAGHSTPREPLGVDQGALQRSRCIRVYAQCVAGWLFHGRQRRYEHMNWAHKQDAEWAGRGVGKFQRARASQSRLIPEKNGHWFQNWFQAH